MFEFFDWIIDFFTGLWNLIDAAGSFLLDMLVGIFDFISMIPSALNVVSVSLDSLPAYVTVFATASVVVLVILRILGRGSAE